MYFHVKPGTSRDDVDFDKPLYIYMKKKELQGWHFDRITSIEKTPMVVISESGDVVDEWNIYMSLSRRPSVLTLEVPDSTLSKFLQNPRFKEA